MKKLIGAALTLGLATTAPRDASACGGLFCGQVAPVVQTGEGIIFTVDEEQNQVQAVINIRYQGAATDFAWLLPLQSEPTKIAVAPTAVFTIADQLTAPRFQLTLERRGICSEEVELIGSDASLQRSGGVAVEGVEILSRDAVGPYESVVLNSTDPEAARVWLTTNGYNVTDEMMAAVTPYVAQGDVLLALRLQKDRDTGDIQPIALDMAGSEACVPIRLTAIAAQADMEITAFVLTNTGRAIPDNYYHVSLNLARIDWLTRGANYRQVVADAADEGEGNAFTTEYAGPSNIFANRLDLSTRVDLSTIASTQNQRQFLETVQGLAGVSELGGIFARYLSSEVLSQPGMTLQSVVTCPVCQAGRFDGLAIDGAAAAREIDENILQPSKEVQKMFDRFSYLTRLYTLISPEEMNVDPEFSFKAGLPDISNAHNAKIILDCGIGGMGNNATASLFIEETQQEVLLDSATPGEGDREVLDQMPGSIVVEQLREGRTFKSNVALIADMLDEHNARVAGCGCGSTKVRRDAAAYSALAFMALALLIRRARR